MVGNHQYNYNNEGAGALAFKEGQSITVVAVRKGVKDYSLSQWCHTGEAW
jgi:hypothetical protein